MIPREHRSHHRRLLIFLILVTIPLVGVAVLVGYKHFRSNFMPHTVTFETPPKSEGTVGQDIEYHVDLKGFNQNVNAIEADITFDPKIVHVKSIDSKGSFASIFIIKTYNNDTGVIRIVAGTPYPSNINNGLHLVTIYFTAESVGSTDVQFVEGSKALADDGKGTNVLKELPKYTITVTQ